MSKQDNQINLGGYDIHNFEDSDGCAFLTLKLQKTRQIKVALNTDDKVPNLDGYIQVLQRMGNKVVPTSRFEVQVKTLNHDYTNNNKRGKISQYKYPTDTKAINVVKEGITLNPVILFLVDSINEKIFWKHISETYAVELEIDTKNDKTIYFNDCDGISELEPFIQMIIDIYDKKREVLKSEEKNLIFTNFEDNDVIYSKLQDELIYLEKLLCDRFKYVTKLFFPEAWRFGIAYQEDEEMITAGIYQIKKRERGKYIKVFCKEENNCLFVSKFTKKGFSLRQILNKQIEEMLNKYYLEGYINAKYLPNIVLEELAFEFLDCITFFHSEYEDINLPGVYYKDEENLSEIKNIWSALIEYIIQSHTSIFERLSKEVPDIHELGVDLFKDFSINSKIKRQKFSEILKGTNKKFEELPSNFKFTGKYKYKLLGEVLIELEKRNIIVIKRVWKPKKYKDVAIENVGKNYLLREYNHSGYIKSDIIDNYKKMFAELPSVYKHIVQEIWGDEYLRYMPKREYIISFDTAKDIYWKLSYQSKEFNIIVNEYTPVRFEKLWKNEEKFMEHVKYSMSYELVWNEANFGAPLYKYVWFLLYKWSCINNGLEEREMECDYNIILRERG